MTPADLRLDKKCGRSGIPENRKCTKQTAPLSKTAPPTPAGASLPAPLKGILTAAGISTGAYLLLRERYRSGVTASAVDAMKRSRGVDTTLKARHKRVVFAIPGVSGSENVQKGEGIQMAWQRNFSPERNKKDERSIMVDTRKANIPTRSSSDANFQEIAALQLKNQIKGRNEVSVELASQIIAFRRAHPDKQIVLIGHSYGGAIAEEALAIVSRTKTNTNNIVSIGLGTNNYGLVDGMVNKNIRQVTLGGDNDPFTANGPTKNLRKSTTLKGHSLRDYSVDSQSVKAIRDIVENRAPLMRTDTRLDKKCGASGIAENKKCTKGSVTSNLGTALMVGAVAGGLTAMALNRKTTPRSTPPEAARPSGPPLLPGGLTPRGLLSAAPPRKSKTERMRENTAAAVKIAEGQVAQTARQEVRRIAQIGNTMAATGEAAGMATKTTLRELRLRAEAARRRWEPGYRPADAPKTSKQLSAGSPPVRIPLQGSAPLTPEAISAQRDPRTGQPRRRKARGFGS